MSVVAPSPEPQGATRVSPYLGPRPFAQEDRGWFFGRRREVDELVARIVADGEVLFYAQSGAGKSSLLNAGVEPRLRAKGYEVLSVPHLGRSVPPELNPDNPFVFNCLAWLPDPTSDGLRCLEPLTLAEYFEVKRHRDGGEVPTVLLLDQVEELFTAPGSWAPARRNFFLQLQQLLDADHDLRLVLAMREDYIAGLDGYLRYLPRQLRSRFRMRRLGAKAALEAVQGPAEKAGRPFAAGVAEELVRELQLENVVGEPRPVAGEFVEPIHLQVVCLELWQKLADRPGAAITRTDLETLGDVDQALGSFFDRAVAQVAQQSQVPEDELRRWFESALLTPPPLRVRRPAVQGANSTDGLANPAVAGLVDQYLLRAEETRGAKWYLLAHDRLIEPILSSNRRHLVADHQFGAAVEEWEASDHDPGFLYSGKKLYEATRWAHGRTLSARQRHFLDASRRRERSSRRLRLQRLALLVLVFVLIVFGGGVSGLWQWAKEGERTARSLKQAYWASGRLGTDTREGLAQALDAVKTTFDADGIALPEAEGVLRQALAVPQARARARLDLMGELVDWPILSPGGDHLATVDRASIRVWDTATGGQVHRLATGGFLDAAALAPGGESIAFARAERVVVWTATESPEYEITAGFEVTALAFHPHKGWLAAGGQDGGVVVWDAGSGLELYRFSSSQERITGLAFAPDQDVLAVVALGDSTRLWELAGEGPPELQEEIRQLENGSPALAPGAFTLLALTYAQDGETRALRSFSVPRRAAGLAPTSPTLYTPASEQAQIALAGSARRFAVAGTGGGVEIWDIVAPEPGVRLHARPVSALALSPDGRWLASGAADGEVKVSPLTDDAPIQVLSGHSGKIHDLAWGAGGRLVTASKDAKAAVWEVTPGRGSMEALHWLHHGWEVTGAAWSPLENDHRLVTVDFGGRVHLWDGETGERLDTVETATVGGREPSGVYAVTWSQDGHLLATAHADGSARLWHSRHQRLDLVEEVKPSSKNVSVLTVAFSGDGKRLAAGNDTGEVTVWDLATGQGLPESPYRPFGEGSRRVNACLFLPDGQRLVVAGLDGGSILGLGGDASAVTLPACPGEVGDLALTPDQPPDHRQVAVGCADGRVYFEPLTLDALITLAEERIDLVDDARGRLEE